MRVAVTGASGLLGRFVVEALAGHEVIALDRVAYPGHDTRIVDILDRDGLHAALRGCAAIIHLAAIDGARTATDDQFHTVNVLGTWNVLSIADALGVARVVVLSSVSALGLRVGSPPVSLPIAVDHPQRSAPAYGTSKQGVEMLAAGFAARGRMTIACLRPTMIAFPPHIPEWANVAAEADGTPPPQGIPPVSLRVLEPLPLTRSFISAEDAARACAMALDAEFGPLCHCYLTAETTMSTLPTPEALTQSFGVTPPVTRPELFARLPTASPFDLEPARIALGWRPRDRWSDLITASLRGA